MYIYKLSSVETNIEEDEHEVSLSDEELCNIQMSQNRRAVQFPMVSSSTIECAVSNYAPSDIIGEQNDEINRYKNSKPFV